MIALALGFGWIEVLRLYQGLGLSLFGGLMLTIGQLAILPNLIAFGASWISGVGFAIGEGSYVSPLATQLGPLPAMPVFAAIPTGGFERGILFALVPVLAAFFATVLSRKFSDGLRWEYATRFGAASAMALVAATVAAGCVAVAHANDGGGSIRIPASECGLVGLKPSKGRVSLGPALGESWLGGVVEGCVSRSVRFASTWIATPSRTTSGESGPPWYCTPRR
ncbi:MAG: hypothetical protein EBW36_04660, partial [Actinobacteria bacterium]|nr:hypothetical protein [Actinomycetota bacterium]